MTPQEELAELRVYREQARAVIESQRREITRLKKANIALEAQIEEIRAVAEQMIRDVEGES